MSVARCSFPTWREALAWALANALIYDTRWTVYRIDYGPDPAEWVAASLREPVHRG